MWAQFVTKSLGLCSDGHELVAERFGIDKQSSALCTIPQYHEPSSGDDRLLTAARKHRIDVDAVARAVREEFAAKAKKAVAKARKPSGRKTKTAAAV
jgi:hypothetical protein